MDKRIKELVEFTKEKYGLYHYNLHNWNINRSITIFNDTVYTISMEWFPSHIKNWNDESYNPKGTACIEIDIHSKKTKRVIFVDDKSYSEKMTFDLNNMKKIVRWIEQETSLSYEKEFVLYREEERELCFKECIDGVAVFPSGTIECKFDEEGKLTFFSVIGQFSSEKVVKKETYAMSLEQVEEVAKEQLRLVEFLNMEEKKLVAAFAIEEIFAKNDGAKTLPFDGSFEEQARVEMDEVIEWKQQNLRPFHRKEITLYEKVTPEQAFQCEPHPDLRPITEEEVQKCLRAIQKFFSQEYSDDSGKWVVKLLHRDVGYIHATINLREQKERVFIRKMKVFIDPNTYNVLNYMDNKMLFAMYMELQETEEITYTKEQAFEKLKDFLTLTPYYVYDFEQNCYVLCGKLDCDYAVNAYNGEVVELSEL